MKKLCGVLAALALYSSYSYSEIVHGASQNAAIDSQQWAMTNVLPGYTGLTVNSISYQYTTLKNIQDDLIVSIQNEQAGSATGLVFQSIDNWSGLPGNTIRKNVPVDNIPGINFGAGEINVQGTGTVVDPTVQYNYSYDPCETDPLTSPACPGYAAAYARLQLEKINSISYDLTQTDSIEYSIPVTQLPEYYDEDQSSKKSPEELDEEDQRDRKKRGLRVAENALTEANALSQQEIVNAMNFVPSFQNYYSVVIAGGMYADASMYRPTIVPENKSALRVGLAQQLLHEKMVSEQYNKN